MQELYRYEVTDQDIKESFRVLSRCPGSRIFRKTLRFAILSTLAYLGVLAWAMSTAPASVYGSLMLLIYLALTPLGAVLAWVFQPGMQAMAQLNVMRAQKRAAGLDPAAPELHSIRLSGASYVRCIEQRASTAVPLAALRAAKPVKSGGVVLLFNTEADDYLPARLFSPAYTARDFCLWITAQAAEARKTPLTLNGTGNGIGQGAAPAAEGGPILYELHFALDAEEAIRLLSRGSKRLYCTAGYWKQQLRGFCALAAVFFAFALIGGLGPLRALWAAMVLGSGAFLLGFIATLLLTSRLACRMRLGAGAMDSLLGPQQVKFYEDRITVCRAAGQYDQGYAFYAQLLDTPGAWFLVLQGASGILPLPKEGLPEHQHAAFAAFVEEKLRTSAAQRPAGRR